MALNYIWIAFVLIAFIVALVQMIFLAIPPSLMKFCNQYSVRQDRGFEISLGLTGILTFWMGILKIAESGGAMTVLSRIVAPFFTRIYPEIPKDHPALNVFF